MDGPLKKRSFFAAFLKRIENEIYKFQFFQFTLLAPGSGEIGIFSPEGRLLDTISQQADTKIPLSKHKIYVMVEDVFSTPYKKKSNHHFDDISHRMFGCVTFGSAKKITD